MLFTPSTQNISDIQLKIREIDLTFLPEIQQKLGKAQTFVYSSLIGCCAFAGSKNLDEFPKPIQEFAEKIVTPIINYCFEQIEKYGFDLNNKDMKLLLIKGLDKIQYYEPKEFENIQDKELLDKLTKILTVGTYKLCKNDEKDTKFHRGLIDIPQDDFSQVVKAIDEAGHKKENYDIGSFGMKGHITSINSTELTQNYDAMVSHHNNYINQTDKVALKPLTLEKGKPQTGPISEVVIVTMEIENFNEYRKPLKPMRYPPHLSIFSKEIKPIKELKDCAVLDFTGKEGNPLLSKMHNVLLKANFVQ